jgi:hypothetical protein
MQYDDVKELKTLGNNPFEAYHGKVVRIQARSDLRSINGQVVSVTDRHLTLEHLDKRTTVIRLSEIAVITEIARKLVV